MVTNDRISEFSGQIRKNGVLCALDKGSNYNINGYLYSRPKIIQPWKYCHKLEGSLSGPEKGRLSFLLVFIKDSSATRSSEILKQFQVLFGFSS